jgi:uncharacterized phiE125 gp8 family phage protein
VAIVDLATAKAFLGVTGTGDDTVIQSMIDAAQDFIERTCGRLFEKASRTDKFSGDGEKNAFLKHGPVNSITSITIGDDDPILTAEEGTEFEIFEETGELVLLGGVFRKATKNIVVVYDAGYLAADMPNDIVLAINELTAYYYNNSREGAGKKSERIGDYAVTFRDLNGGPGGAKLPFSVQNVINNYRKTFCQNQ